MLYHFVALLFCSSILDFYRYRQQSFFPIVSHSVACFLLWGLRLLIPYRLVSFWRVWVRFQLSFFIHPAASCFALCLWAPSLLYWVNQLILMPLMIPLPPFPLLFWAVLWVFVFILDSSMTILWCFPHW